MDRADKRKKLGDKVKKINIMDRLESIIQWVSEGKSQKEIAKELEISERTLRRYKEEYPILLSALNGESNSLIDMAENELIRRAFPWMIEEVKPIKVKREYIEEGVKITKEEVEVVRYKKRIDGDMQALTLILKNKGDWKDNPHKIKIDEELKEISKDKWKVTKDNLIWD